MRKLYVIINEELDPIYGCVQGGHAVAGYIKKYGSSYWGNDYLIYLKAPLSEIYRLCAECSEDKSNFFGWREPDLDNEYTAIAVDNSVLSCNGENVMDKKFKLR